MSLRLELEPELEQVFREAAMRSNGFKKGALQKSAEEALRAWLRENAASKVPKAKDPFKLVEGILSELRGKKTSVELQHEVKLLWTKSL